MSGALEEEEWEILNEAKMEWSMGKNMEKAE